MRKFTLFMLALFMGFLSAKAQTVATFEALPLPGSDTFYVNYSAFGTDVGFDDGLAHFPCVYDTSWGFTFLSSGFVYSNLTDSVTSGFENQYSAKPAAGFGGSNQYIVASGSSNYVLPKGPAVGKPVAGVYVANTTYAFNSMRDGDAFAKKFGGVNGTDEDWFKLVVNGYLDDTLRQSVQVYLADFRPFNSFNDEILNDWKWVNLSGLGNVDSVTFILRSSDTGQFGMNTPAYFCMDNFTTAEALAVSEAAVADVMRIYPNPAINELFVDVKDNRVNQLAVIDVAGRVVAAQPVVSAKNAINVSAFVPGVYHLQLTGDGVNATVRFVKQ